MLLGELNTALLSGSGLSSPRPSSFFTAARDTVTIAGNMADATDDELFSFIGAGEDWSVTGDTVNMVDKRDQSFVVADSPFGLAPDVTRINDHAHLNRPSIQSTPDPL